MIRFTVRCDLTGIILDTNTVDCWDFVPTAGDFPGEAVSIQAEYA